MSERRPIASRNSKLAERAAKALANQGVTPNTISKMSMVFAAIAGVAVWMTGSAIGFAYVLWLLVAALGCQFRLLCNLFDGMVAVESGKGEADGPFWNEAPDRVADLLIFVGMGLGSGQPSLGWAAAALAIGTAYVRELGSAQGLSTDFRGPMAKPQRMALATVGALVAVVLPAMFGWSTLSITLYLICFGSAVTIVRRSSGMIGALNARADEDSAEK